jgi:predicted SprT family Zn-dependent metalloprotease
MKTTSILITVACMLPGCRTRTDASAVKHEFGETRREPSQPLIDCTENPSPKAAERVRYLRSIAETIAAANPLTFTGPYAIEKFCFAINETAALNAFALANQRRILFNSGTIETATHDAEIAATMAHELAHVTMQHTTAVHPLVEKNAEWQSLRRDMADLGESRTIVEAQKDQLQQTLDALYQEQIAGREGGFPPELKSQRIRFQDQFCRLYRLVAGLEEGIGAAFSASWQKAIRTKYEIDAIYSLPQPLSDAPPQACELGFPDEGAEPSLATFDADVTALEVSAARLRDAMTPVLGAEVIAKFAALLAQSKTLFLKLNDINDSSKAKREAMAALVAAILDKETQANWTEQEADEVGFEFYLRTGFSPVFYNWTSTLMLQDQIVSCRDQIAALAAGSGHIPFRGTDSHPKSCWRIYDISFYESQKHADDYAPLLPAATKIDIFDGKLVGLKTPPQN